MNSHKMTVGLLSLLLVSVSMGIISANFFSFWVSLELNMISFIGFIFFKESEGKTMMKYFMPQAFFSSVLFFSFLLSLLWVKSTPLSATLALSALGGKMGLAPGHFWFVSILKDLCWEGVFLVSSIQKILPALSLFHFFHLGLLLLMATMSLVIAAAGVSIATHPRLLVAYSVIYSSVWGVTATLNSSILLFYFSVFTPSLYLLTSFILFSPMKSSASASRGTAKDPEIFWGVMSILGLPPFPSFFIKLSLIALLLKQQMLLYSGVLVVSSIYLIMSMLTTFVFHLTIYGPSHPRMSPVSNKSFTFFVYMSLFFMVPLNLVSY